jgi:putative ATP-dependent endonuclease of the OLD family
MYLSRLVAKNYRSIDCVDIKFTEGKNVIVGKNNSGKSNIMKALDLVLGESSPTYAKSDNITEHDFRNINGKLENEILIWCELSRSSEEQLNYDEMYNAYGFYVHMESYNVPYRYEIQDLLEDYNKLFEFNQDDLERDKKYYVNPKLKNQGTLESQFDDKSHFAYVFKATIDDAGRIHKDIRLLYREDNTKGWILAFKDAVRNELIKSAIIPAFRDPQTQLRLNNWSWYGKLMKSLTSNHGKEKDLEEAFKKVNSISADIFQSVKDNMSNSALSVAFPGTDMYFQFNEDANRDVYKGVKVYVDDGYKSELTTKGAGIQSAAIIGLFSYYTREINTQSSALLCLEEPELYLHPHAKRTVSDQLDVFIKNATGDKVQHQVIITTHSNEFIRTTDSKLNVVIANKTPTGTLTNTLEVSKLKRLIVDDNYNEIFFSDKVILCENFDKYILTWVADELYPGELNKQNVSLISVGGKDQFDEFCKLIHKAGIEHYIFADFDFILRDDAEEIGKYKDSKGNPLKKRKDVTKIPRGFFEQKCIFSSKAQDSVNVIKELRTKLKQSNEEEFYKAKNYKDFDEELHDEILKVLKQCRENGVGILNGEIENLSKDKDVLDAGRLKLSLAKIFQLNGLLNDGKKISELIEIGDIKQFIDHVLVK